MRLLRKFLGSTGGRTVVLVVLAYLAFQVWMSIEAVAKVDSRIEDTVDARGRVNVEVELIFIPERFHILVIQEHGTIRRSRGEVVEVRTTLEGVDKLARKHWVRAIRPLETEGG